MVMRKVSAHFGLKPDRFRWRAIFFLQRLELGPAASRDSDSFRLRFLLYFSDFESLLLPDTHLGLRMHAARNKMPETRLNRRDLREALNVLYHLFVFCLFLICMHPDCAFLFFFFPAHACMHT